MIKPFLFIFLTIVFLSACTATDYTRKAMDSEGNVTEEVNASNTSIGYDRKGLEFHLEKDEKETKVDIGLESSTGSDSFNEFMGNMKKFFEAVIQAAP